MERTKINKKEAGFGPLQKIMNLFCPATRLIGCCTGAVRPDWAIYWTLGNFLKPLATIIVPKSSTFLGNFVRVSKSIIFLLKSFLGNFNGGFLSGHTAQEEKN